MQVTKCVCGPNYTCVGCVARACGFVPLDRLPENPSAQSQGQGLRELQEVEKRPGKLSSAECAVDRAWELNR